MKEFFKFMFASMIGFFISMIIMGIVSFLFLIILIAAIGADETTYVSSDSVLYMHLSNDILDRTPADPFYDAGPFDIPEERAIGLNDYLTAIKRAKTDPDIKGIYLNLGYIPAGLATVSEIREAIADFTESGKFVVSYSDAYSQKAYYIATAGTKIIMNPIGWLELSGLSVEVMFIKGMLEKLQIEPQIIRSGKYKSAVEPFISDRLSDENRQQLNALISSHWNEMKREIADARDITTGDIDVAANTHIMQDGTIAKEYGFIDTLGYKDDVYTFIESFTNYEPSYINVRDYIKSGLSDEEQLHNSSDKRIAVIYATGEIIVGNGAEEIVGSQSMVRAFQDARDYYDVDAVVFRINSPGGSALASEVIWDEVRKTAEVMPVVVSMGNYAASGGYYIACAADTIVADALTLTGSIGVFGILFNGKEFMDDLLGITFDRVNTNEHSDMGSFSRPLTDYERKIITERIDDIYTVFLERVAEGRGLSIAEVNEIAQGRVWSGTDAKEIGLVDEIGGLEKAMSIAADMINTDYYRILELPVQEDMFDRIFRLLSSGNTRAMKNAVLKESLGIYYPYYDQLRSISTMDGIQTRLPYSIEIE